MQTNKIKSATVAGLLGIFLGQFGAHSWYLGKKKQGIIHVSLFAAGMLFMILAPVVALSSLTSAYYYGSVAGFAGFGGLSLLLLVLGWLCAVGNGIWALVEAIIILVKGDAGLAAQGYAVAAPVMATAPAGAAPTNATPGTAPAAAAPANPADPTAPQTAPVAPVAPQPKQPMDPATKKKIILGCVIGAAVFVAIIVACVVIAIVSHIDYGETYRQAKDLKEDISDLYTSYDCERVVSNVNSDWTSDSSYNKYIEACKESTDGIDDKIAELEKTAGIRKDSDLSAAFDKFKKEYMAIVPDSTSLSTDLDLYKTWHSYVVAIDNLSASTSTDAEITSAANILINSGNDVFKTYGEGWLEKTLGYIRAYRAYQNSNYSDSNRSELRDEYYAQQTSQREWVSANKPDIATLIPLNFSDTTKMYNAYRDFYNLLVDTYEENYNSGSGDCSELRGVVYCS